MATPWIFADEFIYSELARSLAEHGDLLIRGQSIYYSTLVPLLHAPGYLFGGTADAYLWIKAANAVVMSAAAIPAYALARQALGHRLSLTFAALVLAWPAFAYTGTVMTEPLFFLAVLAFAWALVRAIRRPTPAAQLVVAGTIGAALLVRLQAVSLLASVPIACVLAALLRRDSGLDARGLLLRLRGYWLMLTVAVGLPLLGVLVQVARSQPVRSLLGGYAQADLAASAHDLLRWTVWHTAVVALSIGLVPLAIAAAAWARMLTHRWGDAGSGPVLATCLAVAVPMLVQVTIFAIHNAHRVQERNLFTLEPLIVLAALVGIATMRTSRVVAVTAAVLVGLAVADLPIADLLAPQPPLSDTFTLLSLLRTGEMTGITAPSLGVIAGFAVVALTVAAVAIPRRALLVALPVALMAGLIGMNAQITPLLTDYSQRVAASLVPTPENWVDRALPPGRTALLVWASQDPPAVAWSAEFWNGSIGPVLAVPTQFPTLGTPTAAVDLRTGLLVPGSGGVIPDADFVVAPRQWALAGERVAEGNAQGAPMTLWRTRGPLRLAQTTDGLYSDGWTGPLVTVRRFACTSGTFVVTMRSALGRHRGVVLTSGRERSRIVLPRRRAQTVRMPARREHGADLCQLTVQPVRTSSGAELGNPADPRELGIRMTSPSFVVG